MDAPQHEKFTLPRPTYEMVRHGRSFRGLAISVAAAVGLGVALWAGSFIPTLQLAMSEAFQIAGTVSLFLSLLAGLILGMFASRLQDKHIGISYEPFIEEFAGKAGLQLTTGADPQIDPHFVPAASATSGVHTEVLAGAVGYIEGTPVSLEVWQSDARITTSNNALRSDLVFRARLSKLFPHTALVPWDGGGNGGNGKINMLTQLDRTFDDNQRVSLEGDLDRFFLFYTHRRTVTDALSLWSPTELWHLREVYDRPGDGVVIETIGPDLYVTLPATPVRSTETLNKFLDLCEFLTQTMLKAAQAQNPLENPNDTKYPYLRSRETSGVVQVAGTKIPVIALALAGVAVFAVFRFYRLWDLSSVFWIASGITVCTIAGIGAYLIRRSSYTKTNDKRGY